VDSSEQSTGAAGAQPQTERNGLSQSNKHKRRPPRIEIREDFCKACGICVAFCPTNVLKLKQGHVCVANLLACTKCMMCELRCPDFAIAVFDPDKGEV